jgi:CheY-like chemotaxis protein
VVRLPEEGVVEDDVVRPVLLVEDDIATRDVLRVFLEREGLEVEVAGDGAEALDRLRGGPTPCVILLDLAMPGMDGWQFMDVLSHHPCWVGVPVVLLTGAADVSREDVLALGADDLLHKPIDPEALLGVIDRYC